MHASMWSLAMMFLGSSSVLRALKPLMGNLRRTVETTAHRPEYMVGDRLSLNLKTSIQTGLSNFDHTRNSVQESSSSDIETPTFHVEERVWLRTLPL